jgi:hypothetical protein
MSVRAFLRDDDLSPAEQAEVRQHAQRALLARLLAERTVPGSPGAGAAS